MTFDRRTEQLFARVTLVSGLGDPARGRFCIMSFVALLAGEGHTDNPSTASPVIRNFAVPVNDAMPHQARQRLKAFAPRIVGTNDGLDAERVALLRRAFMQEILPQQRADTEAAGREAGETRLLQRLWATPSSRRLQAAVAQVRAGFDGDGSTAGCGAHVGITFGRAMVFCARSVPSAERQAWYWDKAVELLDRLCDVGAAQRCAPRAAIASQRVAELLAADVRETDDDAPRSRRLLAFRWLTAAAGKGEDGA